jgi:hypothetical protein
MKDPDIRSTPVEHEDIMYPAAIPFVLAHLACIGAFWTGITFRAAAMCFVLGLMSAATIQREGALRFPREFPSNIQGN